MSNIMDLGKLKHKDKHQHRWVIEATFAVPESLIEQMDMNQRMLNEVNDPNAQTSIPLPMSNDNLVNIEGPGCMKCKLHWRAGYGELCEVSD